MALPLFWFTFTFTKRYIRSKTTGILQNTILSFIFKPLFPTFSLSLWSTVTPSLFRQRQLRVLTSPQPGATWRALLHSVFNPGTEQCHPHHPNLPIPLRRLFLLPLPLSHPPPSRIPRANIAINPSPTHQECRSAQFVRQHAFENLILHLHK